MNVSFTLSHNRSVVVRPTQVAIIADITLLSIAILSAFVANVQVCRLLKQRQDLRQVSHFLLASLAANGIFASVVALPSRLALATLNHLVNKPQWAEHACNIAITTTFVCGNVNALTLSLMAIDRQDCVLRPFDRRIKTRNIKAIVACSWVVILFLSSVLIFSTFFFDSICDPFKLEGLFSKVSDKHPIFMYYIGVGVLLNTVTFMTIISTAIRIIMRLRSSPLPQSQSLHRRQENKLTWLTYKICGVFIVCWLPQIVTTVSAVSGVPRNTVIDALVITSTISYYFYALNPVLNYNLLKRRRVNNVAAPANRQPKDGKQGDILNDNKAKNSNSTPNQGRVIEIITKPIRSDSDHANSSSIEVDAQVERKSYAETKERFNKPVAFQSKS